MNYIDQLLKNSANVLHHRSHSMLLIIDSRRTLSPRMTTTDLPCGRMSRGGERESVVGQIKCCPDNGAETRVRTRITFPDTDLHGI